MKTRLLTVSAGLLFLAACAGGNNAGDRVLFERKPFEFNETQPVNEYGLEHAQPLPVLDAPMSAVPALDSLPEPERSSSSNLPGDFVHSGSEVLDLAQTAHSTVDGLNLLMEPDWNRTGNPPTSDLAWAIYAFDVPGYNAPATLQLWWDGAPLASDLFIGMSDFSTGRWQWFLGPEADTALDFTNLSKYHSPSGVIYVAVLLTGTGDYSLTQLRLGANQLPEAAFTKSASSIVVGSAVDFDASTSTDIDGTIISYEWDFLGSGSFGSPSPSGLGSQQYTQTGNFLVTLRVTDNEGAVRTAEDVVTVTPVANNLDPEAHIVPDKTSGSAPLQVDFDASTSTDPDGTIAKYEWDLDDNGTYETDTGTVDNLSHTFNDPGMYPVTLRVTDNQGSTATDTTTIDVGSVGGSSPPLAKLAVDYGFRTDAGDFQFDASGSSDPDNDIVKYEFDWNGDGTYELDNGSNASASHTYPGLGVYNPQLRVTDAGDRTDTVQITVRYGDSSAYSETEANDDSTASDEIYGYMDYSSNISGWRGNLGVGGYDGSEEDWLVFHASHPGQVSLQLAFIDAEADIDIRLFNDDDLANAVASSTGTGDSETINYTMPETGDYFIRIYIYASATDRGPADYTFTASYNQAPTANLSASPLSGPVPLNVDFDASASFDPDGTIVKYEWDVDGNGTYETNTGAVATHNANVLGGGTVQSKVRVTDDGGATATATVSINVINGAPVINLDASPTSGTAPLTVTFDMSAAIDPDGHALTDFALDANNDGQWNVTGTNPVIQWTYYTHGPLNAKVRVTDEYGAVTTQLVALDITVVYDETEDNDSFGTGNLLPSMNFSEWFGNLGALGVLDGDTEDWYKLTVPSAGTWTINMYFIDNICDLDMKLYDTNGTSEIGSSTSTTDNETITETFAAAGTYYLKCYVYTSGSQLDPQDYMLEVQP